MIKTGGENVFPSEVEAALLELPGIADAAVVGIADPRYGSLVSALIVRSDPALTPQDVKTAVRTKLPGFKIPRRIAFCGELPRLGNEKVDLRRCAELITAQASKS